MVYEYIIQYIADKLVVYKYIIQ